MALKNFYSGTSGLVLPVPQKSYPPEFQGKSRLTYYASLFNSIEINSSFYKLPKLQTVAKWAESVPDDFRFTFKLLKDVTHAKALAYNVDDVNAFMQVVSHVGDKRGCILIQFPGGLSMEYFSQLENLLDDIQSLSNGWRIAIEFRNTTWYIGEVYELLNHHGAAIVVHDIPASATPLIKLDADFVYIRFHGPGGKYRGSYTEDFLETHAAYVKSCIADGKVAFTYFNNTMGAALANLQTFNSMVKTINK